MVLFFLFLFLHTMVNDFGPEENDEPVVVPVNPTIPTTMTTTYHHHDDSVWNHSLLALSEEKDDDTTTTHRHEEEDGEGMIHRIIIVE
jgi:hypothetical protein